MRTCCTSLESNHDPDTMMGCHRLYCSAADSFLKSMRRLNTSFLMCHVRHTCELRVHVAHKVITSEVVA